jgi:hypothetical protein
VTSGRHQEIERDQENHRVYVGVSIDYSTKAGLNRLAKRDHTTVSEKVRTYIEWGIETESK